MAAEGVWAARVWVGLDATTLNSEARVVREMGEEVMASGSGDLNS